MKVDFKFLKFKNCFSYGNNLTEFEFRCGVNLINGSNGCGKSTLNDVLCYGLYGKSYRDVSLEQIINNKNNKNLYVEVLFSKDDIDYKIVRGMKPSVLKIFKDDVEQDLLSHKSLIQDEIDKILGINHQLFKQIVSLSILNNKPFLVLPKAEKTNILESIFNIKVFGKMLKTLKKAYTELKSSLDLSDKELELYKQNLQTFVNQIKDLQKAKEEFDGKKSKEISELELKITDSQSKFQVILSEIRKIDLEKLKVDSSEKSACREKFDELNDQLAAFNSKMNLLVDELQFFEDNDIHALIDRYSEKIKPKVKDIFEKLKVVHGEKLTFKLNLERDVSEKNSILSSAISESENLIKGLNKEKTFLTKDYLEKNLEEVVKLNSKLNNHKLDIGWIKEDLQKLEKGEGVCDYCKQSIDPSHKENEILNRKQKLKLIQIDIEELRTKIEALISSHIKEKNKSLNSEIEILKSKIEESKAEIKENSDKLQQDIQAKNLELEKQILDLESERTRIGTLEVKAIKDNLEASKKEIADNREKVILDLDKVRESLKAFEAKEKIFQEKKSESEKLEIQKTNLKDNLGKLIFGDLAKAKESEFNFDIEKLKSEFEEKKVTYQELKAKNLELKKKIKVSDVIKDVLDESGIKKFFFSRLIPELNKSVNSYLDFFELPVKFEFDSEFDYKIVDFGDERNYLSFSGGERFRIDLSIILSFIQLNKLINGCDINILMMDELLDTAVDSEGMDLILEKLKELTDKENLCSYIISHKGIENNIYIDNVIKIKKVNGFSRIEV